MMVLRDNIGPDQRSTCWMRSSHSLDRVDVAFDGTQLVADAGLLLPATLAHRLGLRELVERHLDLGRKPGQANRGDKLLTLVLSALAGGDCIDDADALRAGGTERILGFSVKAASTLGTFLRSFRWGHVRQLDRISRELLARAWAAGAGPGSEPLTIDLDSTICETYGLKKQGARHHGYTKVRGYHPLLAVAAGTGDVLMARLREGRANTARGAGHFLRETIGRIRAAGATGQLTMRADSGFYAHAVVAVCRAMTVRFSITIRQSPATRRLIEAIPDDAWSPIPYWIDGGADVAETSYTPFRDEQDATPVRLIVRRVRPTPGSQLAAFVLYDFHAFITDRAGEMLALEADHRRHAEIENAIRDLKYGMALNHLPSGRFAANGAWLAVQVMAHNLARWTARIGLGAGIVTTKTLRRRLFSIPGRLTRSARRIRLHLPARWPWAIGWSTALARLRAIPLPT
jgi:Transposase DDE domain group 1